jgi:hypothetical protein
MYLVFGMGICYLTFTGRNLKNKKKLTPVQIMKNVSINDKNIVNNVGMFDDSDVMNNYFSE